jgi:hypothetical protein
MYRREYIAPEHNVIPSARLCETFPQIGWCLLDKLQHFDTPMTRIVADERLSATIRPIRSNPRPKSLGLAFWNASSLRARICFYQLVGGADPSPRSG